MKIIIPILSAFSFLAIPLSLVGQAPAPGYNRSPASERRPAQAAEQQQVTVSPPGNLFESQTAQQFSSQVWAFESDSIDLEEGTLNWKGRTFNLGNARLIRARFERYLASPGLDDEEEIYIGILDRISEMLSFISQDELKSSEQLREEIFRAWQLLFAAARYEMDGGASLVIANQVYNIWRIRDESVNMDRARALLEEERKRQQEQLVSQSAYRERQFEEAQREAARGRTTTSRYQGVTEMTFQAERLVETQARLSALDAQAVTTGVQAKLQYQTQIINLLLQRRYQQCLIACAFYRLSFGGSHQRLEVGLQELKDFIPISDISPTVDTVEFIAREAKSDVERGIRTVDNLFAAGELFSAMERLQETFFLGEYSPVVLMFSPDKKRRILTLYRNVRELQKLADLKDYGAMEELVPVIKTEADDFPDARVLSVVRSAQRLSNLSLMSAQQSMAIGDFDRAENALARATEIWPLNPAIKSFTSDMATRANISTQATMLFDEIAGRGGLRALYDRRTEFGLALMQDPERSAILKEAVERVGTIDMLIAQAEEMANQANGYAAWEMLLAGRDIDQEDAHLARTMARLAPRVADFAGRLDAAERAEQEGQLAYSLSLYLSAQDIYPGSRVSRQGLERVGRKLLAQIE